MATQEEYKNYINTLKDALPCFVCRRPLGEPSHKIAKDFISINQYRATIEMGVSLETKIVIHKDCFIQMAGQDYYFET